MSIAADGAAATVGETAYLVGGSGAGLHRVETPRGLTGDAGGGALAATHRGGLPDRVRC